MDLQKFITGILDKIPGPIKMLLGHTISVFIYAVVYSVIQSLSNDIAVSAALTLGFRAGLKAVIDELATMKTTAAAPRKASDVML